MKKNIIYCALFVMTALLVSGCQKESANQTGMVDYVALKLLGEKQMVVPLGETFVDPGYTATDKGNDVWSSVQTWIIDMLGEEVDAVDTSAPGIFTIYYSAMSQDNVRITMKRVVMVYDPELKATIAGDWAVDYNKSHRYGDSDANPPYLKDTTWAAWSAYYTSDDYGYSAYSMTKYTVTFTEIVPGIYEATDLLGGFYTGLRGYGPVMVEMNDGDESAYPYYSMEGMVLLNADLTVNLITSGIQAWGDALTDLQGELSYDIREKSEILDIHSLYGGMDFNVVMTRPLEEDIEEIEPIR